jgi:hypothetical protein
MKIPMTSPAPVFGISATGGVVGVVGVVKLTGCVQLVLVTGFVWPETVNCAVAVTVLLFAVNMWL